MVNIGKFYTNGSGEFVKIVSRDEYDPNVFIDQIGRSYHRKDGTYFFNNPKYNLSEISTEEIFQKINTMLNKVPEILPCPICGSSVELRWDSDNDSYWENISFQCSSYACGFMYHPQDCSIWSRKQNSIDQKRTIERNAIKEVNRRV